MGHEFHQQVRPEKLRRGGGFLLVHGFDVTLLTAPSEGLNITKNSLTLDILRYFSRDLSHCGCHPDLSESGVPVAFPVAFPVAQQLFKRRDEEVRL